MNPSAIRALFLVLGCVCYRLFFGMHPDLLPNISPMIAVALVGTMYLPRAWGWLVAPVTMLISDAAFVTVNKQIEGSMFSWWTLASLVFYVLVALLGLALGRNKALLKIAAGSVLCSVVFYLIANTFSWWANTTAGASPGYLPTLGGWWQANTLGLPGWVPTWTFLRNGVLGDLFFAAVLLAIFDRDLLLHPFRKREAAAQTA